MINDTKEFQDSMMEGMESALGGMTWLTVLTSALQGSAARGDIAPDVLVQRAVAIANAADLAFKKRECEKVTNGLTAKMEARK